MRAREANGTNVTVVKEAMRLMGLPVGRVRPPGTPALSPAEVDELSKFLRGLGVRLAEGTVRAVRSAG